MKDIVKLRNAIKRIKPNIITQDSNKKVAIDARWRRPKGIHSKMRLNLKGKGVKPRQGYRSPVEARFLSKEGYKVVTVSNVNDLNKVDSESIACITSTVGGKKRSQILAEAIKKNIKVLYVKDVKKKLDEITKDFEESKKLNKNKQTKRESTKKATQEKAKKDEKKPEEKSVEDKLKENKEEKDKVITKGM